MERGGLQIEAAPTPAPLLLEGGQDDWKYEITPYEPGDCRPVVFFDIAVGDQALGRVEVTLHDDVCPRTCENFRCLCTGERGDFVEGSRRTPLWYKGARFHRVIPDFMAQGGDVEKHNGGWQGHFHLRPDLRGRGGFIKLDGAGVGGDGGARARTRSALPVLRLAGRGGPGSTASTSPSGACRASGRAAARSRSAAGRTADARGSGGRELRAAPVVFLL